MDVNTFSLRSLYPGARGQTVAAGATGSQTSMMSAGGSTVPQTDAPDPVQHALAIGNAANPVIAGIILFALLFGLMYLAKFVGQDDDFRSIRPTFYNVVIISLASVIGVPLWKFLATRFPLPGVSAWILAG